MRASKLLVLAFLLVGMASMGAAQSWYYPDSTTESSTDNSADFLSPAGWKITTQSTVGLHAVDLFDAAEGNPVYVEDSSGNQLLYDSSTSDKAFTDKSRLDLEAGKTYYIIVDNVLREDTSVDSYPYDLGGIATLETSGYDYSGGSFGGTQDSTMINIRGIELEGLNQAPTIDSKSSTPSTWNHTDTPDVSVSASDSDGNVVSVTATAYKNGNQLNSVSKSFSSSSVSTTFTDLFNVDTVGDDYSVDVIVEDDVGVTTTETISQTVQQYNPSVDSSSLEPDPPLLDRYANYSASVSDQNKDQYGYTNLTLQGVCSGEYRVDGSDKTPEWNGICKPSSEGWLNATIEAVDDQGAITTTEIDRYLSNDAPTVSLQAPLNQSYFKYDVPLEFSASDSDSVDGEEYTCTVDRDGSQVLSTLLVEGVNASSGFSGTVESDLGGHSVDVSCSDPAGNVGSTSESFEVKAFEQQSVFGASPVFETENRSFDTELKVGSMVNSVEFDLVYDGGLRDSKVLASSGVETLHAFLYHEVPLVETNQSTKQWRIEYDVNISDFQASTTSVLSDQTQDQSQEIYWSYSLLNQSTDRTSYAAGSDILYRGFVENLSTKAAVSGQAKTTQKDNFVDLTQEVLDSQTSKYSASLSTDYINQSNLTIDVVPNYTVEFNGKSRDFNEQNISVTLEQLVVEKCRSGTEALRFNTYKENDRSESINSNLELAADYWNPDTPENKKVVNFSSSNLSTHKLCISPSYAEAKIDSTDKQIQYDDPNDDYVKRSYFLIDQTISNQTVDIPLYMLPKNQSSGVDFKVQDSNRNPISDVVIRIQRYFPEIDQSLTVAMIKTTEEGEGRAFLDVENTYYAFELYKNRKLIKKVSQQSIPSDLSVEIIVGDDDVPDWYDFDDSVSSNCSYNATKVSCDYVSSSESLENVTLEVKKKELIGETVVGTASASTASGTLSVSGFNASASQHSYSLTAYFPGGNSQLLESQVIGNLSKPVGDTGVMLTLFMFLTLSFAGLWKPSASIALGTFGLIISSFLPFLSVSQTALTAISALGAVLVWRMS